MFSNNMDNQISCILEENDAVIEKFYFLRALWLDVSIALNRKSELSIHSFEEAHKWRLSEQHIYKLQTHRSVLDSQDFLIISC